MPEPPVVGYERRDLDARAIAWFAIGLVVTLVLTFVALRWFETALGARQPAPAIGREFPPPRLQADPAADLAALRAADDAKLHSYGWVDRRAGVIRIPIERAIELTAERGLPARNGPDGGTR